MATQDSSITTFSVNSSETLKSAFDRLLDAASALHTAAACDQPDEVKAIVRIVEEVLNEVNFELCKALQKAA